MIFGQKLFNSVLLTFAAFTVMGSLECRAQNCQSRHQFNIVSSADGSQNCRVLESVDNLFDRASIRIDQCTPLIAEEFPALNQNSAVHLNSTVYVDGGKVSVLFNETTHNGFDPSKFDVCMNQAFTDLGIAPNLPNVTLQGRLDLAVPKEPSTASTYGSGQTTKTESPTYSGTGEGGSYIGECGIKETPPAPESGTQRPIIRD